MNRKLLIPLILVALAFGMMRINNRVLESQNRPIPINLVQVIQRVDPSVVYIEAYKDGYKLATGSGVIISDDGIILTAAHMISDADEFRITLQDGRILFSWECFCKPEILDAGFIKLNVSEKLPFSYLGNSDNLQKGEDVFVIGCPFGYELKFTVTKGIVSSVDRNIDSMDGWSILFQVDALVWPGNSGGPVYDMRGQIIGVVVGCRVGYDGISLCVPINEVIKILDLFKAEQVIEEIGNAIN